MSDMPERIWAWYFLPKRRNEVLQGGWDHNADRKLTPYTRTDHVNELVAAAYEQAAKWVEECVDEREPSAMNTALYLAAAAVRKRSSDAIAAIEPAPVSVQEAAQVLELAMQRAQIPWDILKRFQKGEPIAALRALTEKGEA